MPLLGTVRLQSWQSTLFAYNHGSGSWLPDPSFIRICYYHVNDIIMVRKGLGAILKGIDSKSSGKFSVVREIDKACAEGITESGVFSVPKIRKMAVPMNNLLASDSFDRDKFFLAFNRFYTAVMAPARRARGVFHPSQLLDGCERQMYYDLTGTAPSDTPPRGVDGKLQRIFDLGTWHHIYVQSILYQLGLLERAEVPVVNKKRYLSGSADGVFKPEVFGERVVLEIKTMNDFQFKKAVFKPFDKHEFQASIYARELGIGKVLYLYINKNTSEMKEFLVDVNADQLELADRKMNRVIRAVESRKVPDRTCGDRFCDMASGCPFATLCFTK